MIHGQMVIHLQCAAVSGRAGRSSAGASVASPGRVHGKDENGGFSHRGLAAGSVSTEAPAHRRRLLVAFNNPQLCRCHLGSWRRRAAVTCEAANPAGSVPLSGSQLARRRLASLLRFVKAGMFNLATQHLNATSPD